MGRRAGQRLPQPGTRAGRGPEPDTVRGHPHTGTHARPGGGGGESDVTPRRLGGAPPARLRAGGAHDHRDPVGRGHTSGAEAGPEGCGRQPVASSAARCLPPQNFPEQVRMTGLQMHNNFLSGFAPGWLNHRGLPVCQSEWGVTKGVIKGYLLIQSGLCMASP